MLALEQRQIKIQEALLSKAHDDIALQPVPGGPSSLDDSEQLPVGWSRIPQSSWVSCPIGSPVVM
jgi:hypothetical protein